MKRKELKKLIDAEIKTGNTSQDGILRVLYGLNDLFKVGMAQKMITVARKAAGITGTSSTTALGEIKTHLAGDEPSFDTFNEMVEYAEELAERFEVNVDVEKGTKSVLKAIRKYLTDNALFIPKKATFGDESRCTINYMIEAGEEATIVGLMTFVEDECGLSDIKNKPEATDEEKREALKIRVGTKFNPYYHCTNGILIDEE